MHKIGTQFSISVEYDDADYEFIGWNDGVSDNQRTVTMDQNVFVCPMLKFIKTYDESVTVVKTTNTTSEFFIRRA